MNDKLPRRTFLLGWLGGLLAGRLSRSQAQAAPAPTPQPTAPSPTLDLLGSDSPTGEIFTYTVEGLPPGLSINPSAGLISGTIDWRQGNSITLRVKPEEQS